MIYRVLLTVSVLALSGTTGAQQCPAGLAGMPNCLPPDHPASPHAGRGSRPRGAALWEDRAAAVAMGKSASGFTATAPMQSKRLAERAAMAGCKEKGGQGCKVVLSYINSCAALVWGLDYRSGAYGRTVEEAAGIASRECAAKTEDCQVFFSACSLPVRVR